MACPNIGVDMQFTYKGELFTFQIPEGQEEKARLIRTMLSLIDESDIGSDICEVCNSLDEIIAYLDAN